jgi:hypothetical protein
MMEAVSISETSVGQFLRDYTAQRPRRQVIFADNTVIFLCSCCIVEVMYLFVRLPTTSRNLNVLRIPVHVDVPTTFVFDTRK